MSFPKSEITDIYFVEEDSEVFAIMELSFLSLMGSTSPLPTHYAEEIKDDFNDEQVLYDFITLFNHHIHKFIYLIWQDARYYVSYKKTLKDKFSTYLLSLLGLFPQSKEGQYNLDFHKLLPFLGILSIKPKSSMTLASIIRHYLSYDEVFIEECIVSRAMIPDWQKNRLGFKNSAIGESFVIGDFTTVRHLKFRIHFNHIPWNYLYDYSDFGQKRMELQGLISFVLNEPLDFDISLNIDKEKINPFFLSSETDIFLGINSWIGDVNENQSILIEG